MLLRNPVDRAFSHYWDRVKNGYEPAATFEEAIDLEVTRLAGERRRLLADPTAESYNYEHFSYLARGRYAEQLTEWFAHYPREQILVQRSEDLYADPAAGVTRARSRSWGSHSTLVRATASCTATPTGRTWHRRHGNG